VLLVVPCFQHSVVLIVSLRVVESVLSAGDGERLPDCKKLRRVCLQKHQLDDVEGHGARFPGVTATLHQYLHVAQLACLRAAAAARKPR